MIMTAEKSGEISKGAGTPQPEKCPYCNNFYGTGFETRFEEINFDDYVLAKKGMPTRVVTVRDFMNKKMDGLVISNGNKNYYSIAVSREEE